MSRKSVSSAGVLAAAARLKPFVSRTPLLEGVGFTSGLRTMFKCENLQHGGTFKIRGALNKMLQLDAGIQNVCTHSSGNHAIAVAMAAEMRGIRAHIVMPDTASQMKQDWVRRYDGVVHFCEPTAAGRERKFVEVQTEVGGADVCPLIHAFDDSEIVHGQGTATLQILEQFYDAPATDSLDCHCPFVLEKAMESESKLDAILVSVGGGGLMTGCCLAVESFCTLHQIPASHWPKVVLCEPKNADDAFEFRRSGVMKEMPNPQTIADALRMPIGPFAQHFVSDDSRVADVICVSEAQIVDAMKRVFSELKLVVEPSGAVVAAVLDSGEFRQLADDLEFRNVAALLCGGNVDLIQLSNLFAVN